MSGTILEVRGQVEHPEIYVADPPPQSLTTVLTSTREGDKGFVELLASRLDIIT